MRLFSTNSSIDPRTSPAIRTTKAVKQLSKPRGLPE